MRQVVADFIDYLQKEKRFSGHTVVAYRKDLEQFVHHVSEHLQISSLQD
ncbi:MAG: hypothetical protein EP314_02110, partial [Bacteroidetes bacterium]